MSSVFISKANQQIYDDAIKSLAAYFSDVACESAVPTLQQIQIGLNLNYQPVPYFWAHFSQEMVLAALCIARPNWERNVSESIGNSRSAFKTNISLELIDRILHEAVAEEILALAPALRPVGEASVFNWICSHLAKVNQMTMLIAIKAEGRSAVEKVLHLVRLREAGLRNL